jgi:hypothetical protein
MGKQHHDLGWKKQQPDNRPAPMGSTEVMARRLVSLGLASPRILETARTTQPDNTTDSRSN